MLNIGWGVLSAAVGRIGPTSAAEKDVAVGKSFEVLFLTLINPI